VGVHVPLFVTQSALSEYVLFEHVPNRLELCKSVLIGIIDVVAETLAGAACDVALTATAVMSAAVLAAVLLEVTVSVTRPFCPGLKTRDVGLTVDGVLKSVVSESLATERLKVVGLHVI
jgi:hypothetical protein